MINLPASHPLQNWPHHPTEKYFSDHQGPPRCQIQRPVLRPHVTGPVGRICHNWPLLPSWSPGWVTALVLLEAHRLLLLRFTDSSSTPFPLNEGPPQGLLGPWLLFIIIYCSSLENVIFTLNARVYHFNSNLFPKFQTWISTHLPSVTGLHDPVQNWTLDSTHHPNNKTTKTQPLTPPHPPEWSLSGCFGPRGNLTPPLIRTSNRSANCVSSNKNSWLHVFMCTRRYVYSIHFLQNKPAFLRFQNVIFLLSSIY